MHEDIIMIRHNTRMYIYIYIERERDLYIYNIYPKRLTVPARLSRSSSTAECRAKNPHAKNTKSKY